ncbi:MAG: hypothetical protein LBN10_09420 [Propionibacteriaceae bacterium]|jgi:hypothetical protein|nr:hypothetical protein [Propionibacteriaceae bacterium]
MTIASRIRQANPVETPALSPRGRAELRVLAGSDNVPEVSMAKAPIRSGHARRTVRWLAPVAAATLVIAGVTAGMTLSGHDVGPALAPYVFADEIEAPVVSSEVSPERFGTSIIVDIPFAPVSGTAPMHLVQRIWFLSDAGWVDVPENLVFRLNDVSYGVATYQAENWPFGGSHRIIVAGPDSSFCAPSESETGAGEYFSGGEFRVDGDTLELSSITGYSLCGKRGSSEPLIEVSTTDLDTGSSSSSTVAANGVTTNPDAIISLMKQFELGSDGQWVSVPAGYESWRDIHIFASAGGPAGQTLSAGKLTIHQGGGWTVTVIVDEDGQCTITAGEEYLAKAGVQLNGDGTCSYTQ